MSVERSGLGRDGDRGEQWVELISGEPIAFVYHNFLVGRVRTSSATYLKRGRDKIIGDIEKGIADFTFIPAEHGEELQILHCEVGQKYEPHYDYFLDKYNTKNGGQRIATILISDVEEGGETVFPAARVNFSAVPWWNELSDCGKKGLSVKPKMADALLFGNTKPGGTMDESSLHGGCPVIKGTNGHLLSGCVCMSTKFEILRRR